MLEDVTDYVSYVKSRVLEDIENNKRVLGVDYSEDLAMILEAYLELPPYDPLGGFIGVSLIEKGLTMEDGRRPDFHETKKAIRVIHYLWEEYDREALEEIARFAHDLSCERAA